MNDTLWNELAVLSNAHRALAQANTVEEVKDLRDKAEVARKYARCAKLGLETQNQCAEFKLSCERKAGRLLIELGMGPGRPSKRKKSHDGTILADLGINKNQSSRWQQEAEVPDELLQVYVATAREKGMEITAQGLLRLAKEQRASNACPTKHIPRVRRRRRRKCEGTDWPLVNGMGFHLPAQAIEIVQELWDHHKLLSSNLREFCEQEVVRPMLVQRRTVARILSETTDTLIALLGMLHVRTLDRPTRQPGTIEQRSDRNAC